MAGQPEVEFYRDAADEWRWRLVGGNGEIMADSGEGFPSREQAERSWDRIEESTQGDNNG